MRVLVVSEDAAERLRAISALRTHGAAEVVEATSAREAAKATGPDVDVLVVDGDLSPKGGYSFLYELRAQAELEGGANPPAVVLMGREQDRWLSQWAGANAAVLKPVEPFDLARLVSDLVGAVPAERAPVDESGAEVAEAIEDHPDAGIRPTR